MAAHSRQRCCTRTHVQDLTVGLITVAKMGVVHSMADDQVHRVSNSLRECSNSIQGINAKFDEVDEHWRAMQEFNNKVNQRVEVMLDSFKRMDQTFASRGENILETMLVLTDELSHSLEATVQALNRFDIRRDTVQFTKVIIPMTLPLIVLLVELGVSNAFLGILIASLPNVPPDYSRYLLANASFILLGLTLSLLWLGGYRIWLSFKARSLESEVDEGQESFRAQLEKRPSFPSSALRPAEELPPGEDPFGARDTPPTAVQLGRTERMHARHQMYFNGVEASPTPLQAEPEDLFNEVDVQMPSASSSMGSSAPRVTTASHASHASTVSSLHMASTHSSIHSSRQPSMTRLPSERTKGKSKDVASAMRRVRLARSALGSDNRGEYDERPPRSRSSYREIHATSSMNPRSVEEGVEPDRLVRRRPSVQSMDGQPDRYQRRRSSGHSPELSDAAVPHPRSESNAEPTSEPKKGGMKPRLRGFNTFGFDVHWDRQQR